ncbi:MAG: AbrB/MazE/SpoVT family DNA-binding domain-containing protein [Thermoplasmatota archaeon]
MLSRTVRASAKGQLTIPKELYNAMGLEGAADLLMIQEGERLLVLSAEAHARRVVDDLGGWEALAAPAFADVWDNPIDDEVWNDL